MTDAIDNTDIMVILRVSEAQLISMGAADNPNQVSVMQWAAVVVQKVLDDFVQFLVRSFQTATTLASFKSVPSSSSERR